MTCEVYDIVANYAAVRRSSHFYYVLGTAVPGVVSYLVSGCTY